MNRKVSEEMMTIKQYERALLAAGRDPLSVERAVRYARKFGLEALSGEGCVGFGEPVCGDARCTTPACQTVVSV